MPEPTDYPAELEQLAAQLAHPATPRDISYPIGGRILRQAAALIRRQAEENGILARGVEGYSEALDSQIARNAELLSLLTDVEWESYDQCENASCPVCCGIRNDGGHAPDCRLKAALDGR